MTYDVQGLVGPEGWTTRSELLRHVDRGTVDAWLRIGKLVRLQPGVYATTAAASRWRTRVAAAATARNGVVSHGSALTMWDLLPPGAGPIHLTVDPSRSVRGSTGLVLHRAGDLAETTRRVSGLPVTCVERAVVDSWGLPAGPPRAAVRAAAIGAVRARLCRPDHLAVELARRPRLPGRRELGTLVQLLADGCRSELEVWGCLQVLHGPGMPAFVQQRTVVVAGHRFHLDAAYEEVLLAVEMDGAAWHGSRPQRERDLRRDALLATVGWQTLRFSYARLTADPRGCRADLLAAHAARRHLFGER